jgi:hypothetical protein
MRHPPRASISVPSFLTRTQKDIPLPTAVSRIDATSWTGHSTRPLKRTRTTLFPVYSKRRMEDATATGSVRTAKTQNIRLIADVSSERPTNNKVDASTTQATNDPTYRVLNQPGGRIVI